MIAHPDAGEDRRPAVTRARPRRSGPSGRPSRRPAGPGTARTAGCRRPGRRSRGSAPTATPSRVRAPTSRDAGALDQHDRRHRAGADDEVEGRARRGRESAGMREAASGSRPTSLDAWTSVGRRGRSPPRWGRPARSDECHRRSRVRRSATRMHDGRHAHEQRGDVDAAGMVEQQVQALARAKAPSRRSPSRRRAGRRTMLTATPVRKPIITECGTNRVKRPSRRMPAATISTPARSGQQEQCLRTPFRGHDPRQRRPGGQRGGAGRGDDHQPAARGQPAADRPRDARVEPVHRVHPGQHAAAIPSGTLPIAPGMPATASRPSVRRSGRTERSHETGRRPPGRSTRLRPPPTPGSSGSRGSWPAGRRAPPRSACPATRRLLEAVRAWWLLVGRAGSMPRSSSSCGAGAASSDAGDARPARRSGSARSRLAREPWA